MKRTSKIVRETKETKIDISVDLDGTGKSEIKTNVGFFDHMLTALAHHSGLDLIVNAVGDLHVDDHHLVEDIGLCLGQALKEALGEKRGITRYGSAYIPMDEALARVVIDFSGRPYFVWSCELSLNQVGTMQAESVPEFFRALSTTAGMTLHMDLIRGDNLHHSLEAFFKAFARALSQAVQITENSDEIPSTKGIL